MTDHTFYAALADYDEPTSLTEPSRREIVAEAFHVFGEDAARELATHFAVPFDTCRDDIARLGTVAA